MRKENGEWSNSLKGRERSTPIEKVIRKAGEAVITAHRKEGAVSKREVERK